MPGCVRPDAQAEDGRLARGLHLGCLHRLHGAGELLGGKGGIVSLPVRRHDRSQPACAVAAINANCIAPVAKTRMSENVPFEIETGEPEDIAPMAIYLLSDAGRDVNAQIYTVVGGRISVWNQPMEVRTMMAGDDGWTPESIAERFGEVEPEPNPFIADLERRMAEMAAEKGSDAHTAARSSCSPASGWSLPRRPGPVSALPLRNVACSRARRS